MPVFQVEPTFQLLTPPEVLYSGVPARNVEVGLAQRRRT